jgi:hypothetical protein
MQNGRRPYGPIRHSSFLAHCTANRLSSLTLLPLPIALVLLKKLITGALSCVLADGVHRGFFGDIVIQSDISTRDVGRYVLWRFMDIDRHWLTEKRSKIEIEHCF